MSLIGVIEKKIPDISDKTKELLELFNDESLKGLSNNELKDFFEGLDGADEDFMKFVDKFDSSKDVFEQYQQHMIDSGKATSTFANFTKKVGNILKSFGAALGSMAVNWAIGEIIGIAIEGIDNLANSAEHAKEKADSLANSLSESQSKFSQDSEKISELSARYEELSKGVNYLGQNISLSSSQYDEYKSVIQQLSDLMPNLTTRTNKQGEAIGFVGGKIKDVTKKFKEYQKSQAVDFLMNGDSEGNTYEDAIDNLNAQLDDKRSVFEKMANNFLSVFGASKSENNFTTKESIGILQEIIDKYNNAFGVVDAQKDISKLIQDNLQNQKYGDYDSNAYLELIEKNSLEILNMPTEQFQQYIKELTQKIDSYKQQYEASANTIKLAMNQVAFGKDEYWSDDLGDTGREKVASVLSGITTDFLKNNKLTSKESQSAFVQDLIDGIMANKDGMSDALGSLFELNIDDMNIDDARAKIQQFCTIIAQALNLSLADTQGLLGFEEFFKTASNYDRIVAYASNGNYKSAKGITGSKKYNQQDVIKAMEENGINTDEEIDKFKEALDKTKSLEDAIKTYLSESKIEKEIKTFDSLWNSIGKGDDDASKKAKSAKEEILKLAEAGKLTEKEFEKSSIADTFTQAKISIKEATKEINAMVDSSKQLSSLKSSISSIQNAYQEKKDNKVASSSTLAGMEETFGKLKSWDNYKTVLGSTTSKLSECREAQNKLATEFVYSNNFLSQLTDKNKDYYISQLSELGIANAKSVVEKTASANKEVLKNKTEALAAATSDLSGKTNNASEEFLKEANMSNVAKVQLADLIAKEQLFAGQGIDTTAKVEQLNKLAKAYFGVSNAIQISSAMGSDSRYYKNPEDYSKAVQDQWDKLINKQTKINVDPIKVKPIKTKKDSGSKTSKDSTKNTKTEINWLERRLTRMQSIIDLTASKLQNLFSVKAKNNNLDRQIKQSTKLMNQYKIAADRYMEKANSVAKASKNEDGKKVPALSKDIINKVQSGKITKASYSKLIKKYGQDYADKINSYIDYYDKAQEAKKNVQEQKAKIRQDKIDQQQNKVDYASAKIDLLEQRKEYSRNAKDKIKYLNQEKKYYTDSYNAQIKIAKLDGNKVEAQRLQVELEQKLRDLKKEQLEITEEQQQATLELTQSQKERAKDYGSKNSYIDAEIAKTNELYNTKIAIANLEGKSEEAQKLQIEREQQLIALQKEKFNNITHQYENQRKLLENSYKNLSNTADELEARGLIVGASLYSSQIDLNNLKKSGYEEELKLLESQLPQIEQGTDEWYDALDAIQACKDGISDATKNTIELNTAIRNIPFLVNEKITSRLELVSSEFELLNKYMSNKKLVDNDTGNFTNEGTATLATYYAQLLLMQKQTQNTKTALDDMLSAIERGDKGYEDKEKAMQEYYEKYREYTNLSGKEWDIQQKLIDLMKDKYQSELDYLQDIINKRKELLQAEKDAYDYSRTLQEKSKTISGLQKQLEASKGDDSEAGKLRIQQLQVSLDEAKQDLQDTEYDKWISDQQEMLDKLYNEYSAFIEDHMNDVDTLLEEAINYLKDPETKNDFLDTWDKYMKKYGFDAETGGLGGILTALGGEEGSIVSAINDSTNTIIGYYKKQQADTDAANEVIQLISQIGTVREDAESWGKIERAKNAYNSLSDGAKKIVNATSVNGFETFKQKQIDYGMAVQQRIAAEQEALHQQMRNELDYYIKCTYGKSATQYATNIANASPSEIGIANKIKERGLNRGDGYNSPNDAAINEIVRQINSAGHGVNIQASADALFEYMKNIGYSSGGIVGTLQKVPGMNGDDGWVTLKKGEAVLTPEQAKQFQTLAKNLDILNPAVNILSDLQKPNLDFVPNRNVTQSVGDIHINMEFPNVTNYEDFRSKMQSDPKIEKMFKSMIWDKGDLSKYNIRM